MSQFASFAACQMPFRFGLPSAVRAGRAAARGVAGACADVAPPPDNTPATAATAHASARIDRTRIELLRRGGRLSADLLGVVLEVAIPLDACELELFVIGRCDAAERL